MTLSTLLTRERPAVAVPEQQPEPQTAAPKLSNRAIMDLDLVRGLAAILVVVYHWRNMFFIKLELAGHASPLVKFFYFLTGFGHQAVIVFFVLSGFLVGGGVVKLVAKDKWSWRTYLKDRGARLYVVLIPALILGFFLDRSGQSMFGTHGVYAGTDPDAVLFQHPVAQSMSAATLFGNLFFLQDIRVGVSGSNAPLWSLANEFWYYLAFPLLWLSLFTKLKPVVRVLAFVVATAILVFVGVKIAVLFPVWLMGVALVWKGLPRSLGSRSAQWLAFGAWVVTISAHRLNILAKVFAVVPRHFPSIPDTAIPDLLLGVMTTLWLATLITQTEGARAPWRASASNRLSKVSYTFYLAHFPILVFLTAWLVGDGTRWIVSGDTMSKGVMALSIATVYCLAAWWLFERQTARVRARMNLAVGFTMAKADRATPLGSPVGGE